MTDSRSGALRPFVAAVLVALAAIAVGCTRHLYVDAGAPTGGDGSKAKPFKTIREGVNAAKSRTTIHVAEGRYVEDLNTTITRRCVKIKGSTVLAVDQYNWPTRAEHAAIVTPRTPIPSGHGDALFQIQARDVEIEGLQIDGQLETIAPADPTGILISVDGAAAQADGFSIEKNVLVNATVGVATRMAAGKIRGNLMERQRGQGVLICGWPADSAPPKRKIFLERNRIRVGSLNGALFFGNVGSLRAPTFQSLGLPDKDGTLRVEIAANEFACNGSDPLDCPTRKPSTGLHFLVSDNQVSNLMKAARIDAVVRDNSFDANVWYGIVVGQRIEAASQSIGYVFEGTISRNRYRGNGLNAAAFTFRHIVTTQGNVVPLFRYGHDSTYTIHTVQDPLEGINFDYDNPLTDSGTPLNNKLIVNGRSYDGQRIVPCPPANWICPSP